MGISRFEELIAWQKARLLASSIYKLTATPGFARDFGLKDQIQRAAVSVVSNIAEGFERGGTAEFHQFLVIAKASCAELRAQLYAHSMSATLTNINLMNHCNKQRKLPA